LPRPKRAAGPAGINQPANGAVLQQPRFEHFGVGIRAVHHERAAKTGAESDFGLLAQADLGARDLAGVAGNEVVDGLVGSGGARWAA